MTARRISIVLVAIAVMLIAVRLYLLQGLVSVVTIDGGSMGGALPGEHVQITCGNCGRQWLADFEQFQSISYVTCPECGHAVDEATTTEQRPAMRVLIDRGAYLLEKPQRFDVVAFPVDDAYAVKRIVALPGEEWEVRRGELFVSRHLIRKNYSQFRELATVVASTPHRWTPGKESQWRQVDGSWQSDSPGDRVTWLAYQHHAAHPAAREQPSPVQDLDAYNPAEPRGLNEVADVFAECDVLASDVTIECRVHDGHEELVVHWDPQGGDVIARGGKRELARTKVPAATGRCRLAWGLCDRQLFFVMNDHVVLWHELPIITTGSLSAAPLSIGVWGQGTCRIDNVRVLRDIYYLDAKRQGGEWKSTASDGYGVLGDNPPVSIDSRHWDHAVHGNQILGRVLKRD